MDDTYLVLQDAFGRVQLGRVPGKDFRELASVISACISNRPSVVSLSPLYTETYEDGSDQKAKEVKSHSYGNAHFQLTLLVLSLVEKMSVKLLDHHLPQDFRLYTENLFLVLVNDFSFISSASSLFGSKNRLLSHLASKCVSSLLTCELQSSNACGLVLEGMCDEAFQKNSSYCKMDAAIWSLTTAIKETLKAKTEHKSEQIKLLLTRMDSGITFWYAALLKPEDIRKPDDWGTTLTTFMDLLEALSAARFLLGTCVSSQRLLFLHTPALLQLMDSQLDYFVKKHVLLLLKRILLQRCGEDWLSGAVSLTAPPDVYLAEDMGALTQSILQAVNSGWLMHVPVRTRPSFFGGTNESCSEDRADDVILRAVSLVVLKSLEYQSAHSNSGSLTIHTLTNVNQLLQFLSQHCVQLRQSPHPCVCVSVVFADQDDDMIEAARALIVLHTHQKSSCPPSETRVCEMGLNPHCHFVLLLRGLAFDHSVLLDFLISSETCFLEYMVRYLKLLRDDWEGFCRSCQLMEARNFERHNPGWRKRKRENSQPSPMHNNTRTDGEGRRCHSSDSPSEVCSGPSAFLRLVDYGSSEDSGEEEEEEEEEMDVCVGSSDTGQSTAEGPHSSQTGRLCFSLPERECKESLEATNQPVAFVKCTQTSLARRTVLCLMELRTVVARLQKKNLFPYNPASLIKLLTVIEVKSGLVQ